MNTHYQIAANFDLLDRITVDFKDVLDENSWNGTTARRLHKLRRHVEIFGDFTAMYLSESVVRKIRLERVLAHEQSFSRTQYSFTSQDQ